jgi:hypothetical protein
MSIQVTSGAGTSIATVQKGGDHHQRVMHHQTKARVLVTPALAALNYTAGRWMGAELSVAGAFRGAPEPGRPDSCTLVGLGGSLLAGQSPFDFDLVLLAQEMTTPPSDNAVPVLAAGEAANVIQGIIQVRSGDWQAGVGGMQILVKIPQIPPIFAATGETALRVGMLARSTVSMANAANLSLVFIFVQD